MNFAKLVSGVGIVVLVFAVAWIVNLVRFADCDFDSPYKCEVIHGIGILPPAAIVTVWFDTDGDAPVVDNYPRSQ